MVVWAHVRAEHPGLHGPVEKMYTGGLTGAGVQLQLLRLAYWKVQRCERALMRQVLGVWAPKGVQEQLAWGAG